MSKVALVLALLSSINVTLSNARCDKLYANKLSQSDITAIVDKHNNLRSLVSQGKLEGQPKGTNLKTIEWDQKLADNAQNIANTCIYEHQEVHDERFSVGQNIRTSWSTSASGIESQDWGTTIEAWFNEHVNFEYPSTSHGTTGHYTQVVWADTYLVGCGFSAYSADNKYNKFYVCNYGPAGNIHGQAPYRT